MVTGPTVKFVLLVEAVLDEAAEALGIGDRQ